MPSGESEIITSKKSQVQIQEKANIIISDKVLNKIKYLCTVFADVEWSGIIWMDIVGAVEDPTNMSIKIIDFTLLDIGTKAYTEFEVDPSIIMSVYNKYPEYITKKYGCLHSHNTMNVFFSGTDTSTLLEQAFIHNFFVSVIVNNALNKIAKISYKGKKVEVKKITETFYNRIGNILLRFNKIVDETIEQDVVYTVDCNINYETTIPDDVDLLSQINKLSKKMEENKKNLENKYPIESRSFKRIGNLNDDFSDYYTPRGNYKKKDEDKEQLDMFAKMESSQRTFTTKCEEFIKRLMCIDYIGNNTDGVSLEEARLLMNEEFEATPLEAYLEEASEFFNKLLEEVFNTELEKNWYDDSKFQKLRMMLASNFQKLLNLTIPIEVRLLELIDLKLKELQEDRENELK